MDLWNAINPGQTVEIKPSSSIISTQFRTKVESKTASNLTVPLPSSEKADSILRKGEQVEVTIFTDDGLLKFTSEVIDRKTIRIPLVLISRPTKIEKIKPRSYYRLDANLLVQYRIMKDEITPISEIKKGITRDISGGGVLLELKQTIQKETLLELNIHLTPDTIVNAIGKVTFTKVEKIKGEDVHLVGVTFQIINENERDKIVKFIFEQQRLMRRKGMM